MPSVRIFIGLVFLISGGEKVLSPYQNFLYSLQAYQLPFASGVQTLAAQVFPWVELLIGLFLVVGLWTGWVLRGAIVMFGCFIVIVGQALLRGISLENCGCFGELIHIPPRIIIVMDSFLLLMTGYLLKKLSQTQCFSLDAHIHD